MRSRLYALAGRWLLGHSSVSLRIYPALRSQNSTSCSARGKWLVRCQIVSKTDKKSLIVSVTYSNTFSVSSGWIPDLWEDIGGVVKSYGNDSFLDIVGTNWLGLAPKCGLELPRSVFQFISISTVLFLAPSPFYDRIPTQFMTFCVPQYRYFVWIYSSTHHRVRFSEYWRLIVRQILSVHRIAWEHGIKSIEFNHFTVCHLVNIMTARWRVRGKG